MALKRFDSKIVTNLPFKKDPRAEKVKQMVIDYSNQRPRDLQTTIGPSSAGDPCDRSLVAQMSNLPVGPGDPNWFSFIGTATHAEMALVLEAENQRLGKKEWYIEERLEIHGAVPFGSCDAYNVTDGDVWDWKVVGKSTLDSVRQHGPSLKYKIQAHIYGFGWAKRGMQVNNVVICYLPRNPSANLPLLQEMIAWSEPFDIDIAIEAIKRVDALAIKAKELKAASNPKKLVLISATPNEGCKYCMIQKMCPDAKI
jgi:hypothetical protein